MLTWRALLLWPALAAAPYAEDAPLVAGADPAETPSETGAVETTADDAPLVAGSGSAAVSGPAVPPSVLKVADGVSLGFSSYLDVGFFVPQGDGVAYVRAIPQSSSPTQAWTFFGDPWANTVNSQGESADLGLDRTVLPRYDRLQSHGHSTFLVNLVNLTVMGTTPYHLLAEMSVNFEPRSGTLGSYGDDFWVDLAYLDWLPLPQYDLHLFVGKVESTFGREYRTRKAPDRFTVTPSLLSRYTTGNPTGLKVRGSALDGLLTLNAMLSNGSMDTEIFGEFFDEVDANQFKTWSGRLSSGRRWSVLALEVGASGVYGAQDQQGNSALRIHQWGVDGHVEIGDLTLQGEYLRVAAPGGGIDDAPSVHSKGWYVEGDYQLLAWLGVGVRVDRRTAHMTSPPNMYLADTVRLSGTLRAEPVYNVIVKAEYLHLWERKAPSLRADVFTTSAIFRM